MANIVICIDGTGDWAGKNQTNVAELFELVGPNQLKYYDGGVGTLSNHDVLSGSRRTFLKLLDLATATSLRRNVCSAYAYLVENYQPGDQIYLFGFSRGAYACRLLAGVIHCFGILEKASENLIPYVWQCYNRIDRIEDFLIEARRIRKRFAIKEARNGHTWIRFMGLFDTVSSVGVLDRFKVFPYTDRNPSVQIVRHAVSKDESRNTFPELLISPHTRLNQDVKEVWFDGVHRDIGSGDLVNDRNATQDDTLHWIHQEATAAGLDLAPPEPANRGPRKPPGFDPYVFAGLYPMTIFDHSLDRARVRGETDVQGNVRQVRDRKRQPANVSIALVFKFLLAWLVHIATSLFSDQPKDPPKWPNDTMYRWFWPNLKHFRELPLNATSWQGPATQIPPNTARPDYKPVTWTVPDFAGTILGVALSFLILNRGLPWPDSPVSIFGESWSGRLAGLATSTWVILIFLGFLLFHSFSHRLPRVMTSVVAAIGLAATAVIYWFAPEKFALQVGLLLGLGVALLAQVPWLFRREAVTAIRAVALFFVPWFSIMVGTWLLLRAVIPLLQNFYNWLMGDYWTLPWRDEILWAAWILAAANALVAVISIWQDRRKKKLLP